MNLLTYELIEDIKYCKDGKDLQNVMDKSYLFEQTGLISKRDSDMLMSLHSVRIAQMYAEDLKNRFEENYKIYF